MISIATETLLLLREVPAQLPRRPGEQKIPCFGNLPLGQGHRGVMLETVKLGGSRYTSVERCNGSQSAYREVIVK